MIGLASASEILSSVLADASVATWSIRVGSPTAAVAAPFSDADYKRSAASETHSQIDLVCLSSPALPPSRTAMLSLFFYLLLLEPFISNRPANVLRPRRAARAHVVNLRSDQPARPKKSGRNRAAWFWGRHMSAVGANFPVMGRTPREDRVAPVLECTQIDIATGCAGHPVTLGYAE
jgi:hypothetical protein